MRRPSKMVWVHAEEHALAEYPKESCGLIIDSHGLQYVPCENAAATPAQHFRISGKDYMAASARGKIVGVVHSHPKGSAQPSEGDRAACEASGLPWHILAVHADESGALAVVDRFSWQPDGYEAPLVGRSFHYGVLDCWSLARDWYVREKKIVLADFDHGPDGWWDDLESDFSPYEDPANQEKAGLVQLPRTLKPLEGDLIVMQVRSKAGKPNHMGILIDPERGTMLHHLYGSLSERVVYGGYWYDVTRFVLRRKEGV